MPKRLRALTDILRSFENRTDRHWGSYGWPAPAYIVQFLWDVSTNRNLTPLLFQMKLSTEGSLRAG